MPRSHGRIMAAIWSDSDFLALEAGPQRLYLFLLSQSDLSHAGLLPMRIRRWAQKVRFGTPDTIWSDLCELAAHRFVVVDEETEEVLVRTFVRNDGVYKQPKVMLRLREDAKQIESPVLRAAFRAELGRLPLHELATPTCDTVGAIVAALLSDFEDVYAGENPSARVSDTHTDTPGVDDASASNTPSDTPRVRAGAFPQPPTPFPQPPTTVPATPDDAVAPSHALVIAGSTEPNAQTLVAEWIDHCSEKPPSRVVGHVAKEVKTLLDDDIAYERVRSGLAEWNSRGLHPSVLPSIVHEMANRAPAPRGQQATDNLFDAAMARAIERDRSIR